MEKLLKWFLKSTNFDNQFEHITNKSPRHNFTTAPGLTLEFDNQLCVWKILAANRPRIVISN